MEQPPAYEKPSPAIIQSVPEAETVPAAEERIWPADGAEPFAPCVAAIFQNLTRQEINYAIFPISLTPSIKKYREFKTEFS